MDIPKTNDRPPFSGTDRQRISEISNLAGRLDCFSLSSPNPFASTCPLARSRRVSMCFVRQPKVRSTYAARFQCPGLHPTYFVATKRIPRYIVSLYLRPDLFRFG